MEKEANSCGASGGGSVVRVAAFGAKGTPVQDSATLNYPSFENLFDIAHFSELVSF